MLFPVSTIPVDSETDRLVQEMIQQVFQHATVLTIAHRLNTIAESDKILVRAGVELPQWAAVMTPWHGVL